jgi:beta-galactosidase
MQGNESNEWALLDFQQQASDRLKKAAEIAKVMESNGNDFSNSKPIVSPITIIISPISLLMQERKQDRYSNLEAVNELAHQKAAMACYNALMQQGIPVQIKLISEYDWRTKDKNQIVILADVLSLSMKDIKHIERFVGNGNKVIATGLTGLYDENEKSWVVNRQFPLKNVFGGSYKEIFMGTDDIKIDIDGYKDPFPVQLWYTQVFPGTGKVIGMYNNKEIAVRNNYGKGNVLWFPSMIGIGAWTENIKPLSEFLKMETQNVVNYFPFHFNSFNENCYMHTLKSPSGFITIIVNGDTTAKKIHIISSKSLKSKLLYGKGWDSKLQSLSINAEETVVIKWE